MTQFAKPIGLARPDEIALRDPLQALTWLEIDNILNRAANAIRVADLGEERRMAVFAENACETALANLGGLVGGASVVPVNFHLTAEEVAYILEDSGTRMLFVGPETAERGIEAAHLAGVPTVIGWRTNVEGIETGRHGSPRAVTTNQMFLSRQGPIFCTPLEQPAVQKERTCPPPCSPGAIRLVSIWIT